MSQVEYLGRWVDKDSFRTFVYNQEDQLLVKSWEEYQEVIASGLWFSSKPDKKSEVFVDKAQETEEKPADELKSKRENSKNQFRAATNLGK